MAVYPIPPANIALTKKGPFQSLELSRRRTHTSCLVLERDLKQALRERRVLQSLRGCCTSAPDSRLEKNFSVDKEIEVSLSGGGSGTTMEALILLNWVKCLVSTDSGGYYSRWVSCTKTVLP